MEVQDKAALRAKLKAAEAEIRRKHIHKVKGPFKDIRWFLAFFYITCFGIYGGLTHNVASTRTLEKRFGLSAAESGFILSMNDIVNMVLVLVIGYVAKYFSKPRFLGIMCICGGIGCLLFALPYPVFPLEPEFNATGVNQLIMCGLSPEVEETCDVETTAASNSAASYAILLAASALMGLGNSGLSILSVTYIDENVNRHLSALYIGVVSSAYTIGPLVAFVVSFLTLGLPENLKDSVVDADDEAFIGAWWLAFLIWGAVAIVGGVLMAMCPKHLPYYYEQKGKLEKEKQKEIASKGYAEVDRKRTFAEVVKETWKNLKIIFTNVPYLLLVISGLFSYYMVPGLYVQIPKYLIIQFKVDQALASVYTGVCGALVLAIFLVIVGYVIKRFKLELHGAINIYTIGILGTALAIAAMIPWECEQPQLAGVIEQTSDNLLYYPICNQGCNCTTAVQPMCAPEDDISFISPCLAGCTSYSARSGMYTNCSCVHTSVRDNPDVPGTFGGYVVPSICPKPVCNAVIAFLFFFAIVNVFSAMTRLGGIMLQLRFVQKDMRPFALGLTSFIHNGLAFVPGPIVFGAIFDTTCTLWQELECGVRGACIKYNMDDYRIYMHTITLGCMILSLVFAVITYFVVRPQFGKTPDKKVTVQSGGPVQNGDVTGIQNNIQPQTNQPGTFSSIQNLYQNTPATSNGYVHNSRSEDSTMQGYDNKGAVFDNETGLENVARNADFSSYDEVDPQSNVNLYLEITEL